ncbi:DinB family protein [Bacillus weihaiensis]|uniref:DinB family protein n=1 Tax=Bacillus weihaiensis TaxID=1547283 RepID=UPI0023539AF5|nr:DinB family protein [Bacillus weihaiensis]
MLFPYRNDLRKTLIPYLDELNDDSWNKKSYIYPKTISWIISHIAQSEDYWVNTVCFKSDTILTITEESKPSEILKGYISIRNHTDKLLHTINSTTLNEAVIVPTFSDGWVPPSEPTVNWLFNHVYTHEAYHIGQIAIIASLNELKKPLF